MAKTSMKLKQQAEPKFSTRRYNRCKICGRPHAYLRDYGICRICFRELAHKGQIPGVRKASWYSLHMDSQAGRPNRPAGFAIKRGFPAALQRVCTWGAISPAGGNRSVPPRTDTLPLIQTVCL